MLDRDIARLASAQPDVSLDGLEQAIWSRVDALARLQRFGRTVSRVQVLALATALVASAAVGIAVAEPPRARTSVLQISAAAADLAPSTLLEPAR